MRRVLGFSPWLLATSARALIVALSVAVVGPMLHGAHDDDCDPAVVIHDERAHRIQAARTDDGGSPDADHCVACHFARASRGPASWEASGQRALLDGVLLTYSDRPLAAAPSTAPLPARAPPRA
jgi:hypothetical protein